MASSASITVIHSYSAIQTLISCYGAKKIKPVQVTPKLTLLQFPSKPRPSKQKLQLLQGGIK